MLGCRKTGRLETIRQMTDIKNNSGWIVALWGWLVSMTAHDLLAYLSIAVAVLQLMVLVIKINRGGGGEDD